MCWLGLLGSQEKKAYEAKKALLSAKWWLNVTKTTFDTTKFFTENELKIVTNNFEESKIIGRGGYGTVYKAVLPDQRVVAIRKSKIVDRS